MMMPKRQSQQTDPFFPFFLYSAMQNVYGFHGHDDITNDNHIKDHKSSELSRDQDSVSQGSSAAIAWPRSLVGRGLEMNFSRVLLRVPHFAGKAGSLEMAWFTSPLERLSAAIVKSLEHLGIHSIAREIALALAKRYSAKMTEEASSDLLWPFE